MEAKQGIEGGGFLVGRIALQPHSRQSRPASSPLRAVIFLWVGGFWTWVLVKCLSDHYPTVKALLDAIALSHA